MREMKDLVGLYWVVPMFQLKPGSVRGVSHHTAYMGKPCVPVWYATASTTAFSLVYLVCRNGSGKWNVTRVTLHEFDISVLLKQDSHSYLYPWPRVSATGLNSRCSRPTPIMGQVGEFFWNQEFFVNLGMDNSVAQWTASQYSNLAIGGSFRKRRRHGFALRFWYGESFVIKNQCRRGGQRVDFVRR